jgi:hypothetical protein
MEWGLVILRELALLFLAIRLTTVQRLSQNDLREGYGWECLQHALGLEYPTPTASGGWQPVFHSSGEQLIG